MYRDLGQVYSFLVEHRIVESRPLNRRYRSGEKEVAQLLSDSELLEALAEFVAAQGMDLQIFTDTDVPGIARDGMVFMLCRKPEVEPPLFGVSQALGHLRESPTEPKDVTGVWFLHLWALCNYFLYTSVGRGVEEILRYTEASTSVQGLLETARDHIEQVRQEGCPKDPAAAEVYRILTSHKRQELSRRVKGFLRAMEESRLVESLKDEPDVFRQTLLGAIEMNNLFKRTVAHLVSPEDILKQVGNFAKDQSGPKGADLSGGGNGAD